MSHITQVETKIYDRETLLNAIKELGYSCKLSKSLFHEGERMQMEIFLRGKAGLQVGFHRTGGNQPYKMCFFGGNDRLQAEFQARLLQRYARTKIIKEARHRNYNLAREEVLDGNRIRLVLRKIG